MRLRTILGSVALLSLSALSPLATAQEFPPPPVETEPASFSIMGTVKNAAGPLAGASVELIQAQDSGPPRALLGTTSDANGEYVFIGLPFTIRRLTIRVRHWGFEIENRPVEIPGRGEIRVTIDVNLRPHKAVVEAGAPTFITQKVFYATDRKATGAADPLKAFGTVQSKSLSYGACTVTVPVSEATVHKDEILSVRVEFIDEISLSTRLLKVEPLSHDALLAELTTQAGRSRDNSLLVFVHGYRVTFEEAAQRTAELAVGLNLDGPALFYDWTSQGTLRGYPTDEKNVDLTFDLLQTFLNDLSTKTGVKVFHIVAHSMGNRAVTLALRDLAKAGNTAVASHLGAYVAAAADVDADKFANDSGYFEKLSRRVTLYGSSNDQALMISKRIRSGYPRAGDGGKNILVVPGLDTVDASAARTDFMGHSYFIEQRDILEDIRAALRGTAPPQRPKLQPSPPAKPGYWIYKP